MTNASLPGRRLGRSDLTVSCIGLGCMGMSYAYGPTDDNESLRVLHRYVELGGNFLDTAEVYGPYENEKLLGKFLAEIPRDRVIVATKFGFKFEAATKQIIGVDSSPANIRRACDESLTRLGIETIDLLYQHRGDPEVPIEEVIGVLQGLIQAGKVREIGLSEVSPDTLRRATKVHRVAALQNEYSLWTRDIEGNSTLATCRELGVGLVAYSPLGRGFLTGAIQKDSDLASDDWRRTNPRFQADALQKNQQLAAHVKALAANKGCTSAQLAIAWVLAQGEDIIPIPGTKRVKYLEDNLGAVNVTLTKSEFEEIDRLFPPGAAEGERYGEVMMSLVNR
jgi:aryl-alcohol dehydrogenase-like predicted oxidoreductase